MLEGINKNIKKLMELYEGVKAENITLQDQLKQSQDREESYRKQIEELNQQVDNLKLKGAFTSVSGGNKEAKQKIDELIRDIDKCISLLEQ